jgi:hypothetical protein
VLLVDRFLEHRGGAENCPARKNHFSMSGTTARLNDRRDRSGRSPPNSQSLAIQGLGFTAAECSDPDNTAPIDQTAASFRLWAARYAAIPDLISPD